MKIPVEKDRRLLLDSSVEQIFRFAQTASPSFLTKSQYKQRVMEAIESLFQSYGDVKKFNETIKSFVTRAGHPTQTSLIASLMIKKALTQLLGEVNSKNTSDLIKKLVLNALLVKTAQKGKSAMIRAGTQSLLNKNFLGFSNEFAGPAKDASLKILDQLSQNRDFQVAFFHLPKMPDLEGYTAWQAQYYAEKAVIIAEVIGANSTRLGSQGELTFSKIRHTIIEGFEQMNQKSVATLGTALELNSFLSRIALSLHGNKPPRLNSSSLSFHPDELTDCSF